MYNKFKKLEDQEDEEELVKKQKKETKDKKKKKKPSKAEKSDDEEENLDDYQPKSSVNKRKREKRQKRRAEMNASSDSDNDDSKGKAPKKKEPIPDIIVVGAPDPSKDEKAEAVKEKDSNKKDSAKESKKDNDEDIEDEEEKDSVISINDLDDFDVDDSRKKSKKRKNEDDDGSGDGKKKKKKSRRSKLAEKLGFKKEEEPDRPLTFGEKVDKFFTLSGETRFIGFGILFGFGLIGILASFIFLEEIIDEPAPFCILYCLGFLFLIASTFFLLGPCRQIRHLMKPCRFICAAVFLITLILTLVMAIAVEEPTLTIVSLVIQFVAFGLYLISLCPCIQKCCSGMCSLLV